MKISPEQLTAEADATKFRADMLEKVAQLLAVLEAICDHPYLEGRLVLKGGTALNLFVLNAPRLSVDIDLNYVGAASRKVMLEERPRIEAAVQSVLRRERFTLRRQPK
ncbi:MAG: nucleotidyl transferase AbiEii/AbiGii toxin family protein, partial [Caldilineaceae bacterium]|nr:nucleotidyl transferase AbiEii/AbiGii toxin family protein [Caldilineaceae bacterium]